MNRKRLEHTADILRDIGLATFIGGAGDAAINRAMRLAIDSTGILAGLILLVVSIWLAGLVPRKRRT